MYESKTIWCVLHLQIKVSPIYFILMKCEPIGRHIYNSKEIAKLGRLVNYPHTSTKEKKMK